MSNEPTRSRKVDHVRINLDEDVSSRATTGLERYRLRHEALPDVDMGDVSLTSVFLGKPVLAPILVSSMTGGSDDLLPINRRLAEAAQHRGIAMGVGSQRAALEAPELARSFQVRSFAPDIPLLANLGAVQLNYGYGPDDCQRAVDMIEADALILHLNPLQEALQPEGDGAWSGLLERIESVAKSLSVPLIAKEVGWGISASTARQLADAGVAVIDVAGSGGTSWSEVERHRAESAVWRSVAGAFIGWGIPTAESLVQVRQAAPEVELVASGGLRDGIDAAKCIALGAALCGMAGPFLRAASESTEAVIDQIDVLTNTLRVAVFATGSANLDGLRKPGVLIELTS